MCDDAEEFIVISMEYLYFQHARICVDSNPKITSDRCLSSFFLNRGKLINYNKTIKN